MALDNVALIVGGMIVGASGTILTTLMADAMNRSIPNIVAGGFGGGGTAAAAGGGEERPHRSTDATSVAMQLSYADRVVVAPGYGLAVAQAQHTVRELADELEKRGIEVSYAIHPVAGRMPGHMNVLLAEADVPYDALKEMDEINPEFAQTDVTLVIGANDVTNPAAREDEGSPIYGMPILDVDKSEQVIVLKRSMNTGFAGIDNPLFYNENTALLFGDAKASVSDVLDRRQGAVAPALGAQRDVGRPAGAHGARGLARRARPRRARRARRVSAALASGGAVGEPPDHAAQGDRGAQEAGHHHHPAAAVRSRRAPRRRPPRPGRSCAAKAGQLGAQRAVDGMAVGAAHHLGVDPARGSRRPRPRRGA